MVVRASLRLRHHGCVSEQFHGDTWLMQVSGERGWDVYVLQSSSPEGIDEGLRIAESNGERAEILSRTDRALVFKGRNPGQGVVSAIRDSPCWITWPIVYRDGFEYFTIGAPDRAEMRKLHERLQAIADVHIERLVEDPHEMGEYQLRVGDLVGDLTPRQLNVLLHAVKHGYYRSPKETSSEEIARAMGVGSSTVREHIRKAESMVLAAVATILEEYPDVQARATRKRGRPPSMTRRLAD